MLEKLFLSAFITLSLYIHVGGILLSSEKPSVLGEIPETPMAKILLSRNISK